MKRLSAFIATTAVALGLAACGGSNNPSIVGDFNAITSPTTTVTQTRPPCPAGHSVMGCSLVTPHHKLTRRFGSIAGPKFPDVSSYQGHPNWGTARHYISGGVFKMGEYSIDPDAGYNASQLRAYGLPNAGYWFVRPTGCAHEGAQIAYTARLYGIKSVVLDIETGGIAGYAACLNPYVRQATGHNAVIYTAPGTWPGGSTAGLKLWLASYGPSSPPTLSGQHPVAWQYTDGIYGFPTYIPGIGRGDVSIDYSMFASLVPPKPPNLTHYERYDNVQRTFRNSQGKIVGKAKERNTIQIWDKHGCVNPVKRTVCKTSRYHITLLRGRLLNLHKRESWDKGKPSSIGNRNQQFVHRETSKNIIKTWQAGL